MAPNGSGSAIINTRPPNSLITSGTWVNIGDIDGTTTDGVAGFTVSINSDGSTIAYGIPGQWYSDTPSGYQGEVKVKTYSGSTWNDLGETIIGENNLDDFGIAVSLNSDGRTIVIGGDKNDANGTQSGHVRVFEYSEFTNDDTGNYYYQSQTQNNSQQLPLIATSST